MKANTEFKEVKGIEKIPADWEVKKLGDFITSINQGINTAIDKTKFIDRGIPMIKAKDINNYKVNLNEVSFISEQDYNKYDEKYKLKSRDILFTNIGSDLGKASVFDKNIECSYAWNVMRINHDNTIYYKYLYYVMNSTYFYKEAKKLVSGTGMGFLTKESVLSIISLVPKDIIEQEKIAQILSNVDMNIEKTEQAIDKYKQVKKGLMDDLLTGKVRIKDGKMFRETNFKDVKFLGERPEGWVFDTFKDVSVVRQGLQISIDKRFKENNKDRYAYITVQYLRDIYNKANAYYIENPKGNVICKKEDILMTRTGNTGEVIINVEGVFHNNFFLVDYDKVKLNKDFMVHYLKSSFIQNLISIYAGTTTIPDLNHSEFYRIPIIYPKNIVEQNSIVGVLNYQDSVILKEEKYLEKLKKLKSGLMEDLLTGKVRVNIN